MRKSTRENPGEGRRILLIDRWEKAASEFAFHV